MVYCTIHNRYHKGQAAKMACLVSQKLDIPWEDALGRIKNIEKERDFKVNEIWAMSMKEVNDRFWLLNESKRYENKQKLLGGTQ
ncbi:MAG: hypothetical protein JRL30_20315 [Deltaproteobacteria bacterium]|nr:hypothetical protein [Deltaproteobacteria bacterium]